MGLTRAVGLQAGHLILGTFFRRFFTHNGKGKEGEDEDDGMTELRKSELLYDQTFTLVKAFMKAVSLHTVEEVQSFANAHTPATPWVYMLKTLVPKSCCDDAAVILIKVLGGRESTKRIVGGTRWWQVRGIDGVDAQWLAAKKDLREARKRYEKARSTSAPDSEAVEEPACYEKDMDAMPCILYLHGGGYYFGSVDVERYSIQRHARKISGRVFAVNYRLAPQYPFPCALQDVLASYLYLIRPPSGAEHQPVNPAHLIIAGDSAGGGLSIALLQVLRDASLPMPAGGVLISPWCDLTHSFPSIHTNSATDIMPEYGLSMQKPSSLWPPPAEEVTRGFHTSIRDRIRRIIPSEALGYTTEVTPNSRKITELQKELSSTSQSNAAADVGETTSAPESESTDLHDQTITLTTGNEVLKIESQVQLYAPNNLIVHPLVSPVLSYLGGLPPLLVIAGDSEALRDECIYLAHRAAHPEKYPIRERSKKLYPSLEGIEDKFGPTPVHLQVYDDAAHILPVLFPFTTPAKYCYRAVATFCKNVTGMSPNPLMSPLPSSDSSVFPMSPVSEGFTDTNLSPTPDGRSGPRVPFRRSVSANFNKAIRCMSTSNITHATFPSRIEDSTSSLRKPLTLDPGVSPLQDVPQLSIEEPRRAGDPIVYSGAPGFPSLMSGFIRERVSTHGVIRPLEPEAELSAFRILDDQVGQLSELTLRRYMAGKAKYEKKFAGVAKTIEKHRTQEMKRAHKDTLRNIAQLLVHDDEEERPKAESSSPLRRRKTRNRFSIADGLAPAAGSWSWVWAIDGGERPPPSSIVSRRDTQEARRLAKFADQAVAREGCSKDAGATGANSLWSALADLLTVANSSSSTREEVGQARSDSPSRMSSSDSAPVQNENSMRTG